MKKIIMAFMLLAPLGLAAQQKGFERLMNKYEGQKGVTVVNLGENLVGSIFSHFADYLPQINDDVTAIKECDNFEGGECNCEEGCVCEWICEEDSQEQILPPVISEDEDEEQECASVDPCISFKKYIESIESIKVIVVENPKNKFKREVNSLISGGGYKSLVAMNSSERDIRICMIEENSDGNCDILAVVGEKEEYTVVNFIGKGSITELIGKMRSYL